MVINLFSITKIGIFLLLTLINRFKGDNICYEQWNQLSNYDMNLINDVKLTEEDSILFYQETKNQSEDMDVAGMAWLKENISRKSGIKISFKPSIVMDSNYYGLQKYPQGFAIVLTSTIGQEIGEKRSGIGFQGLYNAIAFYFDFIQNNDRKEISEPHFSVAYNLTGKIEAVCKKENLCNKPIPNFYDNELDGFDPNMKISIELYGGKLKVFFNKIKEEFEADFPEYGVLMDNDNVFLGISSSMTLYKSVKIEDLQIMTIVSSDTPLFGIKNSQNFIAGSILTLTLNKKSSCGVNLNIFKKEQSKFNLTMNDFDITNSVEIKFNDEKDNFGLEILLRNVNKEGSTKFTAFWKSNPIQTTFLNVFPAKSLKFNVCNPKYDEVTNKLYKVGTTSDLYYIFDLCVTDLYNNQKSYDFTYLDDLIKIEYPNNIIPEESIKYSYNKEKTVYTIKVPVLRKGTYKIYNANFFNENIKFFNIVGGDPDFKMSYGEIKDYLENRITKENKAIYLNLILRDKAGGKISNEDLSNLKCSFQQSVIVHNFQGKKSEKSLGEYNLVDGLPTLFYVPTIAGEYIFIPKLNCVSDIQAMEINCPTCNFYVSTSLVDNTNFQIYSDFYEKFFSTNEISNSKSNLVISLDEEKNFKLTSILILDTSGVPITISNLEKVKADALNSLLVKITDSSNKVINVSYRINPAAGIDIFIDNKNDRTKAFSAIEKYYLVFSINNPNFTIAEQKIPLKFSYRDEFLNNISNFDLPEVSENFVADYAANTYELRAASNQFLFKIMAKNSMNQFSFGKSLNCNQVVLDSIYYRTTDVPEIYNSSLVCEKTDIYLNIIGSFIRSGIYDLSLKYNNKTLYEIEKLTILPRPEIKELKFNPNNSLIKSFNGSNIYLSDQEVGSLFSFEMTMIDEFDNIINHKSLNMINMIKVENTGKGDVIQVLDGSILVIGNEVSIGEYSVKLTLPNLKTYNIFWKRISNIVEVNSSGSDMILLKNEKGGIQKNYLQVNFYLYDKFDKNLNYIASQNKSIRDKYQLYSISPSEEIIEFIFDRVEYDVQYNLNMLVYNSTKPITERGEYRLFNFYNDLPVECQICYVNLEYSDKEDKDKLIKKTEIFVIGYKTNTLLYTNEFYQSLSPTNNLPIYAVFKDEFNNEISEYSKKIDLGLFNENGVEIARFCHKNFDYKNRQYLDICKEFLPNIQKLESGNYFIAKTKTSETKYKLTFQKEFEKNSVKPSKIRSLIQTEKDTITGLTDNPAQIIVDFRNEKNQRFENIDLTKISISTSFYSEPLNSNSENLKLFNGPLKGLVTVLLYYSKSNVEGTFTINFESDPIIENLKIKFLSGRINSIVLAKNETQFSSKNRYNTFCLFDQFNNPVRNFNYNRDEILNNLMIVQNPSNKNSYCRYFLYYNLITGCITLNLKKDIVNNIIITSPFIKNPIQIPGISLEPDFTKSFAYLDNINDSKTGDLINLKIKLMNIHLNPVQTTNEIITKYAKNFSVMVLSRYNGEIQFVERISFNQQMSSPENGIVISSRATKSGDYYFIPIFNNIPIKCTYCRKQIISESSYIINLTTIKIKFGNIWKDKQKSNSYLLYKKNFPVFKIHLRDSSNTIISNPIYDLSVNLISEKGDITIPLEIHENNTDGIIAFLNQDGRNKYINLEAMTKLKLKISKANDQNASVIFENFHVMNSEINKAYSSQCADPSIPNFIDVGENQIITAGKEAILEFSLEGCEYDENTLTDKFDDFQITICSDEKNCSVLNSKSDWFYKIIPSDNYGRYILLIGNKNSIIGYKMTINYKNSNLSSNPITLNVFSDNKIANIIFETNDYEIINNFIFIKLTATDFNKNKITRDFTSTYLRDAYFDILDSENKKVFYDLTFKPNTNQYYLKLFSNERRIFRINVPNSNNMITIMIEQKTKENFLNSVFSFDKFNYDSPSQTKTFSFDVKVDFRNSTFDLVEKLDISSIRNFNVRLFTMDMYTDNVFENYSSEVKKNEKGGYTILFDTKLKFFDYVIIEFYGEEFDQMVCNNCFILPTSNNYMYLSGLKSNNRENYLLESDSVHYIRRAKDILFLSYKGEFSEIKLLNLKKSTEIKLNIQSKVIIDNIKQTFIGFDSSNSSENSIESGEYKLVINNGNSIIKEFKIISYDNDEDFSRKAIDLKNILISGVTGKRFYAGQTQYFFIEFRDSNNTLTITDPKIMIRNDIKWNIISTTYPGIYLVEYTVEKIPNLLNEFKLKILDKELDTPIYLNVLKRFPEKMDSTSLHSRENKSGNIVVYQVNVYDKYNNIVCDYRLNFEVINDENMNDFILYYDSYKKLCLVELTFYGKSQLLSPLLNDIQLNLENYKDINISKFTSFVQLDSNNFKKEDKIRLETIIGDEYGRFIKFNNIQLNIQFLFYYVNENGKKSLVKDFITSSSVSEIDNKNFPKYGNYAIKTIVDHVEFTKYTHFRIYKTEINSIADIELKILNNNIWEPMYNIYDEMNSIDEKEYPLIYPYNLLLNFINADKNKINIPLSVSIKSALISDPKSNSSTDIIMDFEGILNSQTTFLISNSKTLGNTIFHLPRGKYYLRITVKFQQTIFNKYIPVNVRRGLYQNNDLDYHMPIVPLEDSFEIVGMDGINTIYSNLNSFSTANICIKFKNKIFNQYLDQNLFKIEKINPQQCTVYTSTLLRGCSQISIMCSSLPTGLDNIKSNVIYNGKTSSNDLSILIDPALPPSKFSVIVPFPEISEQNKNIISNFKILDKSDIPFKYINSDNFEIYDNNKRLEKNINWKFLTNNGAQLQLNLLYPPQLHNIKVLFKYSNGLYQNIIELSKSIKITQGKINPSKTNIGLPIYYKSGDELNFPIIFKDDNGYCFEDSIDINLIKLKIYNDNSSYEDFKFLESQMQNVESCSKFVSVTGQNFPLKKVGNYKVEFTYNKNVYNLSNNKLYISPNIISIKSSKIIVRGKEITDSVDVKPGEKFDILINGTDQNQNQVPYTELVEKLSIKIGNLNPKNNEYKVDFYSDDSFMIISLIIRKPGSHKFDILIDNQIFNNESTLNKINVISGDCASNYPTLKLSKEKVFVGEYAELIMTCRDVFNNKVDYVSENQVSIKIIAKNVTRIDSHEIPYLTSIKSDTLTARFLVLYTGDYELTVYLRGVPYGLTQKFQVIREKCPDNNPIMCSDRSCVDSPSKCKDLISSKCTPEKPFYCTVGQDRSCVAKLEECTCRSDSDYCKGMCIGKNMTNFCLNKPKIDCSDIPNAKACFDGSCKVMSDCGSDYICPLGFKMCGPNCISKDLECIFNPDKCPDNMVTCWDFSCSSSYFNCPTRTVCNDEKNKVCPDGTCVRNAEFCPQPPICYSPFSYLCPDFTCRKSEKDCDKRVVCPIGYSLCENHKCALDCRNDIEKMNSPKCKLGEFECKSGKCVEYPQLCPSEISCKGKIRCQNGGCANTVEECKYLLAENKIFCPNKYPILCSDLTCVDEISKCDLSLQNLENCPIITPFRCPNNECRKNPRECPTTTTCPDSFPVLCNDSSCKKASYHCKDILSLKKDELISKKYLCSNGVLAYTASQCPTQVTCNEGMKKCWNGACSFSLSKCPVPKVIDCPPEFPYRCFDGECRKDFDDCPTIGVCPLEKPIKCLDNSCRESLDLCPKVNDCPDGYVPCPDGTCALADKCSTLITCPKGKPYLCQNKKCVNDLRLCQKFKECKGFLCPDGECVNNRLDCMYNPQCSNQSPVRCDNRNCVETVSNCLSEANCPVGYITCKSGECKANEDLCGEEMCPPNIPVRCHNGECTINELLCDTKDGCPITLPIKCNYGSCKKTIDECIESEKKFIEAVNNSFKKNPFDSNNFFKKEDYCLDGSKKFSNVECPNINGCYEEKSIRCADGTCVKDSKDCYLPKCRYNKPIKCPDGNCVTQASDCNLINSQDDYESCKLQGFDGYFMCADGSCVITPELCRVIFDCPDGLSKCEDGTCRVGGLCPIFPDKCPPSRSEKCNDGRCKENPEKCISLKVCNNEEKECPDKSCISKDQECPKISDTSRVCEYNNTLGYLCPDGRCLANKEKCYTINLSCNEENPILCQDGKCRKTQLACQMDGKIIGCDKEKEIQCPDKTCVGKDSDLSLMCKNKIGCPLVRPFKCFDGTCVNDSDNCKTLLICPATKPFQCPDLRCVEDISYCNRISKCPPKFEKCNNGLCAQVKKDCEKLKNMCPVLTPIRCPNGLCVRSYKECQNSFRTEDCNNEGEFFCVSKGECVKTQFDCIGKEYADGGKSTVMRILQTSIEPENNCSVELPYSCFDGSCRSKRELCPLPKACLNNEFRCPDGTCVKNNQICNSKNYSDCKNQDYKRCADGLCRKQCPEYNGCNLFTPFQCSNGRCVRNIVECLGYSMCPSNQYRCFNGECKNDPNKCEDIKRLFSPDRQIITISRLDNFESDLVYDRNRRSIASLYLPANTIKMRDSLYASIEVKEVPHSYLKRLSYVYNQTDTFQFSISNTIKDSDGDLNFENSVVSPIINITCVDCENKFNFPGVLRLEHNFYNSKILDFKNYCLARLEDKKWTCFDTISSINSDSLFNLTNLKYSNCTLGKKEYSPCGSRKTREDQESFAVDSFGVYAIVIIPVNSVIIPKNKDNIIFENLKLIIISSVITTVIIFILYNIFVRILRYRKKYLDNKKRIHYIKTGVSNMMNINLDFPGATIGDAIDGIIFEANPSFKFKEVYKDIIKEKEQEIDRMAVKEKNLEKINEELDTEIQKIRDDYNELRRIVDIMKKT